MTLDEARKRLLVYAVDRLGREEAAKRLSTDVVSLQAWIKGTTEPPSHAVMALADVVHELQKSSG
jgi:hypothetical protein